MSRVMFFHCSKHELQSLFSNEIICNNQLHVQMTTSNWKRSGPQQAPDLVGLRELLVRSKLSCTMAFYCGALVCCKVLQ